MRYVPVCGSPLYGQDIKSSLKASGISVGKDIIIGTGFSYQATVDFSGATAGGSFSWVNTVLPNHGYFDLTDLKAHTLPNPENTWPEAKNLRLKGMVFSQLGEGKEQQKSGLADMQIRWLRLQAQFVPQPYEQMATVLREMGYEEASVKVSVAQKWDEGITRVQKDIGTIYSLAGAGGRDGNLLRYGKVFVDGLELIQAVAQFLLYDVLWYFFFGWMIQYGYRPWNALFISIGFIFIGTVIFGFAEQEKVLKKKDSEPARGRSDRRKRVDRNFSAFIYSLETFVPLVKLGVAEYWRIDANEIKPVQMGSVVLREPGILVLRYYWVHIIAGWERIALLARFPQLSKR